MIKIITDNNQNDFLNILINLIININKEGKK